MPPEPAEAPVGVIRPDAGRPDIEITGPEPAGPDLPPDPEAQIEELRTAIAILDAQRDEFLHLLLQSSATGLGRAAQRWQTFTRNHGWPERVLSRPAHWLWMLLTLRWPGGLRVNPLFDETWYREQYDDAPAGRRAAFRQYRQRSMTDGRDPNPLFDTGWYLTRNPDVRGGHLHPLDHYLLMGWREARDPGPAFNGFDYLRQSPECVALAMCPLEHLMRSGGTGRIDAVADPSAGPAGPRSSVQRTRDYYQRYGARRTVAKVASRLMSSAEEDGGRSAGLPQLVLDAGPEKIRAHLDTPRTDAPEGSSTLLVTGWACSDAGISSIEVYIDEALAGTAEPGLPRPDVADALPEVAGSGVSGFAGRIRIVDTEPGHHGVQVVIRDGGASVRTMFSSFERIEPESMYHHYYVRSLPSPAEVEEMERWASSTKGLPRFLFVVIDEHDADLRATLASIAGQSYAAVRCVVFSADGDEERVRSTLDELGIRRSDRRWSVASGPGDLLPARKHADRMVGFIRAGETLTPHALFSYAAEAASRDVTLAYSDHDAVRQTGQHVDPWFLPEWSPDHLLSRDYIGGVYVARDGARLRELVPDLLTDGGPYWRYRLLLALGSEGGRVVRVPRVLWSAPEDRGHEAEQARAEETIVIEALAAQGGRATVSTVAGGSSGPLRRIRHELVDRPRISVIVPTTARRDLAEGTIELLADGTDYPDLERIFVDNSRGANPDGIELLRESGATVLKRDEPFNWAKLNNDGARIATGEYLLFLNDDMASLDRDWLVEMLRHAQRPGIGAVGAALFFPGGTIQHAGVFVVGHGGGAVHLFHRLEPDDDLYLDLHRVTREVSAATGACLLVRRSVFHELGGFDTELAVVGNDVDFCLRLARTGRTTLWTPDASLIHHESLSRSGISHLPDEARMWDRWSDLLLGGDPHYDPNLAQDRVDCGLDWGRIEGRVDPITRADPSAGINLVGYISAEMGVGEATRGEARALWEVGVPFVIIDHRQGNPARMADRSWSHKVHEEPIFDTNLLHLNADVLATALAQLPADLRDGRRNIGYWTWELPEFPSEWHAAFELVDEVWVPTTFVRDAIGKDAPVPVRILPHAIRAPSTAAHGRTRFELPNDAYQFLAMYDTHSVQARKNPQGALAAFTEAFGEDPSASLVLKVNNSDHRELEQLSASVADRPNVHLITDTLSREEMDALMACSDAFVSLHRSEGFGLPIAEGMANGLPVVVTGWSGNMDFTDDETAAVVDYRLVTLERSYGPYKKGQRWAEPDLDDAARWMRRLHDDPELGIAMGQRAAATVRRMLSPEAVGSRMAEYLADR